MPVVLKLAEFLSFKSLVGVVELDPEEDDGDDERVGGDRLWGCP